uniref:Uncharacterized protein n=1 Tax=viral metagenome TaxID=1070528 RepID=A0A6C0KYS5_9ZZZZ
MNSNGLNGNLGNNIMNNGGNNMMEMMKSQIMTMLMFKSMNNNGSSSQKDNSVFDMLYIFFMTQILDLFFKNLPFILSKVTKYSKENIKNNMLNTIVNNSGIVEKKEKISSITIQINISDHDNIFGQALLDYITNNDNTKHVSFKKQNFILHP